MISLFRSFDIFFHFSLLLIIFFISFGLILIKFWKVTLFNLGFQIISSEIISIFYRIKNFKFKRIDFVYFILFFLLVFINFASIFPYIFPFSSQVSFNLFWAFSFWSSFLIFHLLNNWKNFLSHAIPEGSPLGLIWFLFLIEIVRSFIRPMTLIIRLLANITAGHLLLILLSGLVFVFNLAFAGYLVLNVVEIVVSLIQAYIFVVILSLYVSEIN